MAEHEPPRTPEFDKHAIGETLRATPTPVADVAFGAGEQFVLRDGRTRLEVYPDRGVSRLTGQDLRVELFRSPAPVVQGAEVMIAQGSRDLTTHEATLSLTETGGVIFTYVAETPESAQTAEQGPGRAQTSERAASGGAGSSGAAETIAGNGERATPTTPDAPVNREAEERVRLTGRLGRDPSFYTTRHGKRVAKFPLAINQADGKTAWHDVLAFGDHADALKERSQAGQLGRGNAVDVVGYWHENSKPGADGTPRPVRELYAVAVSKQQTPSRTA